MICIRCRAGRAGVGQRRDTSPVQTQSLGAHGSSAPNRACLLAAGRVNRPGRERLHAPWVWLLNGDDRRLGTDVVVAIEEAAVRGQVYVSAISIWEVAMLESKGRIRIFKDCLDRVRQALSAPGMHLLPLSPEVAVASCRLPGAFHGDPADRILVASARLEDLHLVTYDTRIIAYGGERYVSVITS